MKKLILLSVGVLLGASTCLADHVSLVTRFRGVVETPEGKIRVTEADLLSNPANFLVTSVDLDPSDDFDLEEWSDTDGDGIPDTFVARLFGEISLAVVNERFGASLRAVDPADGSVDQEPSFTVQGKAKFESPPGGSILRYTAKVVGQTDFFAADGPQLIKGTLRGVGPDLD